eukprot:11241022-Ditylum_brightwellii.AAC.1
MMLVSYHFIRDKKKKKLHLHLRKESFLGFSWCLAASQATEAVLFLLGAAISLPMAEGILIWDDPSMITVTGFHSQSFAWLLE